MYRLRVAVSILAVITVSLMVIFGLLDMNKRNAPKIYCKEKSTISVPTDITDAELLKYVTAIDREDGVLTKKIVVERQFYFLEKGLTTVVFSVCDSDNNTAKLERKLRFTDYHSPEIKLNNDLIVPIKGNVIFRNSVTLIDKYDGDLTSHIKIISPNYNRLVAGKYDINFKVTNSFSDTCDITVQAIVTDEDYSAATIRLSEYLIYASKGEEIDFSQYITTVLNHYGQGYTTENVEIDASEYNPDKAGTYNIFYAIKSGETNITRTRLVVIVREDKK